METILKDKGIWKTIGENRPTAAEAAVAWDKSDQEVLTIMRLSIEDDQIKHIRNINTSKTAWNALKEVHERDTPGNKIRLLREIVGKVAHEGDNIQAHLDEMVEKFQRLTAMGEVKPEFLVSALLLNSLPKSYDSLVLALETRNEAEFNINVVKNIVCEEYRRRTARDGESDGAALKLTHGHGRGNRKMSNKPITCFFCRKPGHIKAECRKFNNWKS